MCAVSAWVSLASWRGTEAGELQQVRRDRKYELIIFEVCPENRRPDQIRWNESIEGNSIWHHLM